MKKHIPLKIMIKEGKLYNLPNIPMIIITIDYTLLSFNYL